MLLILQLCVLAGLVLVAFLVICLWIRQSRAASREQEQLSEVMRQMKRLQTSVSSLSMERLCELLPEVCDAAIEGAGNGECYYRNFERSSTAEELPHMERDAGQPFAGALGLHGESWLPSQLFGMSLAALRAIKFRYHTDSPKTFSREPAWVFGGHDAIRKRLLGLVSSTDDPIPVGEQKRPEHQDTEREGGV